MRVDCGELDPGKDNGGSGESRKQRRLHQLLPRRQPGKLLHDDVEVVLDRVEVAAGLIDLLQRKSMFISHAHGMPESRYRPLKVPLEFGLIALVGARRGRPLRQL